MYIQKNDDTICAPATIPGTGAITVIRVSGETALEIADKVVRCRKGKISESQGYTIKFGVVYDTDDSPVDEVLVSIFKAPHSYTGENSVEISCHASSYIAGKVMDLLCSAGARPAEPGEFTLRSYLNGKMDLAQAEAVADLIASRTSSAHNAAFKQMRGGFSNELKSMRAELLKIVSLMELELDFSEEEVEFADRTRLNDLVGKVASHISRLIESFKLGNAIKNGIPVAIAGATNAGKSTLLNCLLGEDRAIVSDIHGTTRDTIEETMNIDGVLYRFIDTAGIRETDETVERIGIERTFQKIYEADIILGMIDGSKTQEQITQDLKTIFHKTSEQKLFILVNKTDLWNTANRSSECQDNGIQGQTTQNIGDDSRNSLPNKNVINENNFVSSIADEIISLLNETKSVSEQKTLSTTDNGGSYMEIDGISAGQPIEIIGISAKNNIGIDTLRNRLSAFSKDRIGSDDQTLITNTRHYHALVEARTSLLRVQDGLNTSLPTDLVAQDIRETIYHLGSIVGEISTDEVLGNIFQHFCIGK